MGAYESDLVNAFDDRVLKRLERELERMGMFKNASDSLKKTQLEKQILEQKQKVVTLSNAAKKDPSIAPELANSLLALETNNPQTKGWSDNIKLDYNLDKDLKNKKIQVTNQITNLESKLNNLDPFDKTKPEARDSLLQALDETQQKALDFELYSLAGTSQTRENKLNQEWKVKTHQISQLNNTKRRLDVDGEPLDQAALSYPFFSNVENLIRTGNTDKAALEMGNAKKVSPYKIDLGYQVDGKWQYGRVSGTDGFKTTATGEKYKDGKPKYNWVYKKDDNGDIVMDRNGRPQREVKDGYKDNIPGYEGLPVYLFSTDTGSSFGDPVSSKKEVTANENIILNAYKDEQFPYGIGQFNAGPKIDGKDQYFYAPNMPGKNADGTSTGKMVPRYHKDGNVEYIGANITSRIVMNHKIRNDEIQQQKVVSLQEKTNAEAEIEGTWNSLQSVWDASPINVDSKGTVSSNATKFQDKMTIDFLGKNTWFDKKEMTSDAAITTKQNDLLRFMKDHLDPANNFNDTNTHQDLKKAFKSENDMIKGAEAVFRTSKWKSMMNSSNPTEQVMNNFDLYGWDTIIGDDYDEDSKSQAEIIVGVYKVWEAMERRRKQLLNLDTGGQAPRPE